MSRWISPLCLILALAMLIAGFAVWVVEAPQASVDLHRARTLGDEGLRSALETQLRRRQWARQGLIAGLFCGGLLMVWLGFASIRARGAIELAKT